MLRAEPGAERVEERLEDASIGAVNLSEVVAKLSGDGAPRASDQQQEYAAGMLRRSTRRLRLSFGDRAGLALAHVSNATALTADRSWSRLELNMRSR